MKLLIVDDHPVVREGLAALLAQVGPDISILQASDAQAGLDLCVSTGDIDLILLDLSMPGMPGMAAISAFGDVRPDIPIIVLSSSDDPRDARKALVMGALGYVPKTAGRHTLLTAIGLVMNGERYLPPLLMADLLDGVGAGGDALGQRASPDLTERQIEVLRRLDAGQPNKIIAADLGLSEKTVKAHVTAIFKALGVVNRSQAVATGRRRGLLP